MAGSPTVSFPDGDRLIPSPSSISIGRVLPANTYLTAQTVILFPLNDTYPETLRLRLSAKYPANISTSDYIAPSPTKHVKWRFNLSLSPREEEKQTWTNTKEAMMEEHERMQSVLGLDVKIAVDGLVVTKVNGREVHLEGKGSRMMWTESKGAWTMFQAQIQSTAPSWLRSPTLPPSADLSNIPKSPPRPYGYRPITSLLPPRLNLPAGIDTYAGLEKRKRSDSPTNRHATSDRNSISTSPAKKALVPLPAGTKAATYAGRPAPNFALTRSAVSSSSSIGPSAPITPSPQKAQDVEVTSAFTSHEPPVEQLPAVLSPPNTLPPPPTSATATQAIQKRSSPELPPSPAQRQVQAEPSPEASEATEAMPARSARAEAEAAARARALRLQAVQNAQQESEQARLDSLRSDKMISGIKYTPLAQVRSNTSANVMGIVVRIDPPKRPKDYIVTLVITDPTTHTGEVRDEDLVVTLFRPSVEDLPMNALPGTPILFRNLKMNWFKEKVKGNAYTNDGNGWVYLLNGNQPKISDATALFPAFSAEEFGRLQALQRWWQGVSSGAGPTAGPAYVDQQLARPQRASSTFSVVGGKKVRCLGEIDPNMFSDIVVKILHVVKGRSVDLELYITDGTMSKHPLRNFHHVEHPRIGPRGIHCVGIQRCRPDEVSVFQVGNYVLLRNVRSKVYRDEMELTWSELVTRDQDDAGWKARKPVLISAQDERALEIERRISGVSRDSRSTSAQHFSPVKREAPGDITLDVKRPRLSATPIVEMPSVPAPYGSVVPSDYAVPLPPLAQPPLATHVSTIHTDPINHPTHTLTDVLANRTFPNKFRVKAKVQVVHPRRIKGGDSYAQRHCGRCNQAIVKMSYCQSCGDIQMEHASWQYRFVAILEDAEALLPILITDKEAAKFLPPLPPYSASTNPNDIRKTTRQLEGIKKAVMDVLQGAPMDGIRPQPYIDWTIASHRVPVPKGYVGPHGEREVVVYKAFGMKGRH